ncbi:MAG: tail fiber domain-containing protein [Pyrinomonadaceae bacterium]
MKYRYILRLVLTLFLVGASTLGASAQSTSFNYQGNLKSGGNDANGSHDFEFALFNAESGGAQLGSTVTQTGVAVTNGIFAVTLDFGNQFPGASRFLEIRVRLAGGGAFTTLTPRQPVSSTPYAIKSTNSDAATTATNATQLGGVAAAQFVQTADPRLSDARPPTAGSSNYIQNTTTLQSLSNFNVSGTGTANVFNSTSDYNIFGFRVLSILGANNAFVGVGAGTANSGSQNAFFGRDAGEDNTTGSRNAFFGGFAGRNNLTASDLAFFGADSGAANTTGITNSFFGSQSGRSNTIGSANSFFGAAAGQSNVGGIRNSFFGYQSGTNNISGDDNTFMGVGAGTANTSGSNNSFFGRSAGQLNGGAANNSFFGSSAGVVNSAGGSNSFFGSGAGFGNTQGNNNSFFGNSAGTSNTTGASNTMIGDSANVGAGNLNFATAIGAQAVVGTSNTVVLGRPADTVQVPGTMSVTGTLSGNIVNAGMQFNIGGNRVLSIPGASNVFAGSGAGAANTTGFENSFFGTSAGQANTEGVGNSFFGRAAGFANTEGDVNSFFGSSAGSSNTTGSSNSFFGRSAGDSNTEGGSNSFFGRSAGDFNAMGNRNSFFGHNAGRTNTTGDNNTLIGESANVGSGILSFATAIGSGSVVSASNTIALGRPDGTDRVRAYGNLTVNGTVTIGSFAASTSTNLCTSILGTVALCSSSIRYKNNVASLGLGLDVVSRLRPVTFRWNESGEKDLGLIAEETEAVDPLLVTYNQDGQIQGVKYGQLTVVLINAVKEQQSQIEKQRRQLDEQRSANTRLQAELTALKALVCATNKETAVCKEF